MIVHVDHLVHYQFDRPVELGNQIVRLRPPQAIDYHLKVYPPCTVQWLDGFAHCSPTTPTNSFAVNVQFLADVKGVVSAVPSDLAAYIEQIRREVFLGRRDEEGVQSPEETLGRGSGSCRDVAWLLVQRLHARGLDARFVAGYRVQPGTTDMHAWVDVLSPVGWVSLDPAIGVCGDDHLPTASAAHYRDAAPVSGRMGPAMIQFSSLLEVTELGFD